MEKRRQKTVVLATIQHYWPVWTYSRNGLLYPTTGLAWQGRRCMAAASVFQFRTRSGANSLHSSYLAEPFFTGENPAYKTKQLDNLQSPKAMQKKIFGALEDLIAENHLVTLD